MAPKIPFYTVPQDLREIHREIKGGASPLKLRELWQTHETRSWADCPSLYVEVGRRLVSQGELLLGHHVLSTGLEALFPKAPPPRPGARASARVEPEDRDPAKLIPAHRELFAPLCQQKALALAQLGAYEAARAILQKFWDRGLRDGETEGILARTYKDEAFDVPIAWPQGEEKKLRPGRANLSSAEEIYFTGFRLARGRGDWDSVFYCGINAAACAFFLEQYRECSEIALAVLEVLRERAEEASLKANLEKNIGPRDAWWLATWGEACLYLHLTAKKLEVKEPTELVSLRRYLSPETDSETRITSVGVEAVLAYENAVRMVAGNTRDLSSMRRQVDRVANFDGSSRESPLKEILEALVLPLVISYSAWHPDPAVDCERICIDKEVEKRTELYQAIARELEVIGKDGRRMIVYTSLSCPAEILFTEAVLRYQHRLEAEFHGQEAVELHVFLPFEREKVEQWLEKISEHWARRFRTIVNAATTWEEVGRTHSIDVSRHLMAFTSSLAHGRARLRAHSLDTTHQIWTGKNADVLETNSKKVQCRRFEEDKIPKDKAAVAPQEIRLTKSNRSAKHLHYLPILFSDIEGYGALSDEELIRFSVHFPREVKKILKRKRDHLFSPARTQGDSVMAVFKDLKTALEVAVELKELVQNTPWADVGVPRPLKIRVALDAGPCCTYKDHPTNRKEYCGYYVNRASRIEPVTTPGEVFASDSFAALWSLESSNTEGLDSGEFKLDLAGRKVLAKGHGEVVTWVVRRREKKDPKAPETPASTPEKTSTSL